MVKNLVVDLLQTSVLDWYIREIFSGKRRIEPLHLVTVPFLTKQLIVRERDLSYLEPLETLSAQHKAVARIAREVIFEPHTKMQVIAATSVSGLLLIKPVLLNQHFTTIRVIPEVPVPSQNRAFGIITINFSSKRQKFSKLLGSGVCRIPAPHFSLTYIMKWSIRKWKRKRLLTTKAQCKLQLSVNRLSTGK